MDSWLTKLHSTKKAETMTVKEAYINYSFLFWPAVKKMFHATYSVRMMIDFLAVNEGTRCKECGFLRKEDCCCYDTNNPKKGVKTKKWVPKQQHTGPKPCTESECKCKEFMPNNVALNNCLTCGHLQFHHYKEKSKEISASIGSLVLHSKYVMVSHRWQRGFTVERVPDNEDPNTFWKKQTEIHASVIFESDDGGLTWNIFKKKGIGAVDKIVRFWKDNKHKTFLNPKDDWKSNKFYHMTKEIHFQPGPIGLVFKGNKITHVIAGSQADIQGICVDWRILKVNNKNVNNETRVVRDATRKSIVVRDRKKSNVYQDSTVILFSIGENNALISRTIGKNILQRGICLLLKTGFLESAAKACLEMWKIIDRKSTVNTISKWKTSICIEEKRKKEICEIGKKNDRAYRILHCNELFGFTNEISAILRLILYSDYRNILLLDHYKWIIWYMIGMFNLRCFRDNRKIIKKSNNRNEYQIFSFSSVVNQHFMVADFILRIGGKLPKDIIHFKSQHIDRLSEMFVRRIRGVEVIFEPESYGLYHFEVSYQQDLLENSNVKEMRASLKYMVNPNEHTGKRQRLLMQGILKTAYMFQHQTRISQGSKFKQSIADHDVLFDRIQTLLALILNITMGNLLHVKYRYAVWDQPESRFVGLLHIFISICCLGAYIFDHYSYHKLIWEKIDLPQYEIIPKNYCLCCTSVQKWLNKQLSFICNFCPFFSGYALKILYLIFSVVGLLWYPVTIMGCLMVIVFRAETSKRLLFALYSTLGNILMTFLLAFSFIYLFAMTAFFSFSTQSL